MTLRDRPMRTGSGGVRLYKFFRQVAQRKYEPIPELAGYGFVSKARAEKKARELAVRA